jgi:membrane protein DedA with SNARE-associated domain
MIVSDWGSVTYGAVFVTVLAEFLGVPIPSSMVLIVSGALAARGHLSFSAVVILAFVAATIGDSLWFVIGRLRAEIFIKGYCKLSLGSRDCVRRTKELFLRFPRMSLLVGKFVPGVSTFVVPVAGFSGTAYGSFLRYDAVGIFLWASSMSGIGYGAGEWIQTNAMDPERLKWSALALLIGILICFYAVKLWRRSKFGTAAVT